MSLEVFVAAFVVEVIEEAEAAAATPRRRAQWRINPWDLNETMFKKHFRVTKHLCAELINMLKPLLQKKQIDVQTKVLCALNFFATGSYQTPVGNNCLINISQASASRCIQEVVVALNDPTIFNEWVRFPRNFQEMDHNVRDFYNLYEFPGIIGCIDCTHVAIVPPAATIYDERSYVNRKNYHSINTQLICDAKLKIINVNSLFPGSTHDSHIWKSSNVRTLMESLYNQGHTNYHLIGDSGYALRPWCLTPLSAPEVGSEIRFNEALKKTRATIERCNGVLKSRFRCLLKDRVLHYTPNKATKIINACTVLHNMCIEHGINDPEMVQDQDQLGMLPQVAYTTDNVGRRANILLQIGRIKQANIVRNYFG